MLPDSDHGPRMRGPSHRLKPFTTLTEAAGRATFMDLVAAAAAEGPLVEAQEVELWHLRGVGARIDGR